MVINPTDNPEYHPLMLEFRKKFPGITRRQLYARHPDLYERMKAAGLLNLVPTRIQLSQLERDPKQKKQKENDLYRSDITKIHLDLADAGLIHRNPAIKARLEKAGLRTRITRDLSNPLEVYERDYPNITRGELQNLDPSLYTTLVRTGEIEKVPLKIRTPAEHLQDYYENWAGTSRMDLYKENPRLYFSLRYHGLMHHVPSIKDLKEWKHDRVKMVGSP